MCLYTWIFFLYFSKIYRSFATGRFFKTIGKTIKLTEIARSDFNFEKREIYGSLGHISDTILGKYGQYLLYILDVLCRQLMKLFQVVSTS